MRISIQQAAGILLGGGVVSCPTEGVFGLSCMPDEPEAILRLLRIKQRDPSMGLILIAASRDQLLDWIAISPQRIPEPDPGHPVTWIVKSAASVSPLILGRHSGIAVRLTTNKTAQDLCNAVDSALVSSSANVSGQPVARNRFVLRRRFSGRVDYIVPGDCGPARGPSSIRDLETGRTLR